MRSMLLAGMACVAMGCDPLITKCDTTLDCLAPDTCVANRCVSITGRGGGGSSGDNGASSSTAEQSSSHSSSAAASGSASSSGDVDAGPEPDGGANDAGTPAPPTLSLQGEPIRLAPHNAVSLMIDVKDPGGSIDSSGLHVHYGNDDADVDMTLNGSPVDDGDGGLLFEFVGSSRVDLQACKLEYSIVSPK